MGQTRFLTGPLCVFDTALGVVAVFFPGEYLRLFHPHTPMELTGLLGRTGVFWLGFALAQGFAFFRWRDFPEWILVVAVMRLLEVPADLIYVGSGHGFGELGRFALLFSPAFNFLAGWWLASRYLLARNRRDRQQPRSIPESQRDKS